MDRATLERAQPWRVDGNNMNSGLGSLKQAEDIKYSQAANQVAPSAKSLFDVVNYQRELYASTVSLGIRLANLVSMLDGSPANNSETPAPSQYPEEAAPIAAIITRINNTQEIVNACAYLLSQIEQRIGG